MFKTIGGQRWLTVAAGIVVFGGTAFAEEGAVVSVLDADGRTQSLVETDPGSLGTVKVFVQDEQGEGIQGVSVTLFNLVEDAVFNTTKSLGRGVASFFEVPTGTYQVQFDCGAYELEAVELSGNSLYGTDTDQSLLDAADRVSMIDENGSTRAVAELPIGERARPVVKIASSEGRTLKGITVRLSELNEERELEVLQAVVTDDEGRALFEPVPGGEYRVQLADCAAGARLGGVSLADFPLSSLICPPTAAAGIVPDQSLISGALGFDDAKENADQQTAEISILDQEGRTQSLVEAAPGSKGTVKVFVLNADGQAVEEVTLGLESASTKEIVARA
ncbi:MAG: hypothetical protein KDD69_19785, partial [Bdellovibrionales bacterium]|nr:hypothetical protein [Bdellovibrionales bacterium]